VENWEIKGLRSSEEPRGKKRKNREDKGGPSEKVGWKQERSGGKDIGGKKEKLWNAGGNGEKEKEIHKIQGIQKMREKGTEKIQET